MNLDPENSYCIDLLQKLVNIPSVYPNEEEIINYLEQELTEKGLNPKRIDLEPGRSNLLCSIGSGYPRICLNAHADTVHICGESQPVARIDGDLLRGLGSCDDKASVASMITAFRYLASHADQLHGTVDLMISVDEEGNGRGVESVIESGYTCDYAIVGECTGLDIVHAHCGVVFLKLFTTGTAAHGSTPSNGRNAILRMIELVNDIESELKQFPPHYRVGAPSINLGEIHAGDQPNRVPDKCVARVDIRLVPPMNVSQIIDILDDTCSRKGWASYDIERQWEPVDTPVDSVLIESAMETSKELDIDTTLVGWRGGTEAEPFFTRLGVDVIVLGPGDILQAHSTNEFVSISQTQQAVKLYIGAITRLQDRLVRKKS